MEDGMTATLEPATETLIKPHRFTVDEFQKMFEHGIVSRHSQLIRGEIYFMAAMGAAHANAIAILTELLVQGYSKYARVSPQCPIVIWDDSEPEPDFALVKRDAKRGLAKAEDVLLAIEVSDSTLRYDREKKLPEYARSSIPETWIVNLNEAQLEVYTQPEGEQYLKLQIFKPEMTVAPLFAPEVILEWWRSLIVDE
jgi:Uma2 family endonuclease